ncbi:MAG: hypothetical protein HZA14_07435 [Nitrospirae bacterium]|nr:hypothetical protein [Nitrospirota bacterium]
MIYASIKVCLKIRGPILCKATATSAWGIDATFAIDYTGRPVIERSHIKGKLREALRELGVDPNNIITWLGKEEDRETGMLEITDFYSNCRPEHDAYEKRLTRTRMDRKRGVVEETALVFMENRFPLRSEPYEWEGTITFFAEDEDTGQAGEIHDAVKAGLKWIAAFGSEKSVGLGRLKSVKTELNCEAVNIPAPFPAPLSAEKWFTVTIKPSEPLLIGGVKRKSSTYMESETIIHGGMIKGALAETLNQICGAKKYTDAPPIDDVHNSAVKEKYPNLAKHFSDIRFTHAFPSKYPEQRPVVIPYSAVSSRGDCRDAALCKEPKPINGSAPIFQVDWKDKDYPGGFGWPSLRRISRTRTAIDEELRRAEENRMFTYGYVCPKDEDGVDVVWVGWVKLPDVDTGALQSELEDAIRRVTRLGKRRSRVEIKIKPQMCGSAQTERQPIENGLIIVALQSDALMADPDELLKKQTADKLKKLYEAYWSEVFGSNTVELVRFFAHQRLLGGYLGRRMAGGYYPFYLTGAGSVFVLKADKALECVNKWKNNGLPVPAWAKKKYGNGKGEDLWQRCPFVPQNGYGEVAVNLNWHFKERIDVAGGGQ